MLDEIGGVASLVAVARLVGHPHSVVGDHDDLLPLVVVSQALLLFLGWVHDPHPAPSSV
jgi:hypothetical protein